MKNSDLWMFFIGSWFGFLIGMIIFNMPQRRLYQQTRLKTSVVGWT